MHVGICNRLTLISCSWLDTILSMTLDVRKAGGRPGWIPSNYASFAWWPVADLVSGVRIGLLLPLLTLGHLNLDRDLTTLTTADQPSNWNLTRERGCILSGILCRYPALTSHQHQTPDLLAGCWPSYTAHCLHALQHSAEYINCTNQSRPAVIYQRDWPRQAFLF